MMLTKQEMDLQIYDSVVSRSIVRSSIKKFKESHSKEQAWQRCV